MHASELVGHYAIRRSVVILSKDKKIMDPSYIDPNKPAYIRDYDFIDNKIILVSHEGIETVLTGEYDDDKWVAADDGKKYNSVTIPAGYHSVLEVYDYMKTNSRFAKESYEEESYEDDDNVLKCNDIVDALYYIVEMLKCGIKTCPSSCIYSIYARYNNGDSVVNIRAITDKYGAGYTLARRSGHEYYDAEIICDEFTNAIDKLLSHGIIRIPRLMSLLYANSSSYGYQSINNICSMANSECIDASIIIFSAIKPLYMLDYYNGMMHIMVTDGYDPDEYDTYATVFITMDESIDLDEKVNDGGVYECECLQIG